MCVVLTYINMYMCIIIPTTWSQIHTTVVPRACILYLSDFLLPVVTCSRTHALIAIKTHTHTNTHRLQDLTRRIYTLSYLKTMQSKSRETNISR